MIRQVKFWETPSPNKDPAVPMLSNKKKMGQKRSMTELQLVRALQLRSDL